MEPAPRPAPVVLPHLDFPVAPFGDEDLVAVHLHGELPQRGDGLAGPALILGLHAEEGEVGRPHAVPGQQVGTGALEMEDEAVEGAVVRLPEHHAGAGLHGAAGGELAFGLAHLVGAASGLLAVDLIVEVQAAAFDGAVQVLPEHLPSPQELPCDKDREHACRGLSLHAGPGPVLSGTTPSLPPQHLWG